MGIIPISECLRQLESGKIALIEFYQYDEERQTGGKIDCFCCQLLQRDGDAPRAMMEKPTNVGKSNILPKKKSFIRKVRIVVDGQPTAAIRTIHPILIRSFNGIKTVV
jgi:hypothetical protein